MRTSPQPPTGTRDGEPDPDATGQGSSPAELESLVKKLRSDLGGVHDGLKRAARVEWQRLKVRAVDAGFRAAFFLSLLAFAVSASITAAILIAAGIRGALAVWSRAGWVGDLGAGFAILGIAIGGALGVRAHLRNECVLGAKRDPADEGPAGNGRP